jgi:hypothetical protein
MPLAASSASCKRLFLGWLSRSQIEFTCTCATCNVSLPIFKWQASCQPSFQRCSHPHLCAAARRCRLEGHFGLWRSGAGSCRRETPGRGRYRNFCAHVWGLVNRNAAVLALFARVWEPGLGVFGGACHCRGRRGWCGGWIPLLLAAVKKTGQDSGAKKLTIQTARPIQTARDMQLEE